jgi:hypothetical protein
MTCNAPSPNGWAPNKGSGGGGGGSTSVVVTTINTSSVATAADLVGGVIQTTAGGAITITTDNATNILAELTGGGKVGDAFYVEFSNNQAGVNLPVHLVGGAGVTFVTRSGTIVPSYDAGGDVAALFVVTDVITPAVSVYLGPNSIYADQFVMPPGAALDYVLTSDANGIGTWQANAASAPVTSVTAANTTLTLSPTVGAVLAGLNLSNPNTWLALQKFTNGDLAILGTSTGYTLLDTANTTAGNFTATFPAASGTVAYTSGANVASVTAANTSLTISPTTGAVLASLNVANANSWTAQQTFANNDLALLGTSTGVTFLDTANTTAGNFTATFPAASGTVAYTSGANVASVTAANTSLTISPTTGAVLASLNVANANSWTAQQTFANNDLALLGTSTGVTFLDTANTTAGNFTATFPAASGTVAYTSGANVASVSNIDGTLTISPTTGAVVASLALGHANNWTATQTFSAAHAINIPTGAALGDVLTSDAAGNGAWGTVAAAGAVTSVTAGNTSVTVGGTATAPTVVLNVGNANTFTGIETFSNGILFGNASPSNLNFYTSEAAWTPVLSFGSASVGITYAVDVGVYTRIGNLVFVGASIQLTSKGSSTGAAQISGLPFPASAVSGTQAAIQPLAYTTGITPSSTMNGFFVESAGVSTSIINLMQSSIVAGSASANTTQSDTNYSNTSILKFTWWYYV